MLIHAVGNLHVFLGPDDFTGQVINKQRGLDRGVGSERRIDHVDHDKPHLSGGEPGAGSDAPGRRDQRGGGLADPDGPSESVRGK